MKTRVVFPARTKRRRTIVAVALTMTAGASCRCSPHNSGETAPAQTSTPTDTAESTMKCPKVLDVARRDGATIPNRYVVPSDDERKTMRSAIAALLSRGASARTEASDKLHAIDFEIDDLPEIPGAIAVHEIEAKKRGGGAYVIRLGESQKLIAQAPHTFFDEGTYPLACDFFDRAHARALFLNTMHRYKGAPEGPDGIHPSDVAHSASSLFQAATEGAIDALGTPTVVQLHGFAEREAGGHAVISTGEKQRGNPFLIKMKEALEAASGPGISRYPDDTKELGATTNVQGQAVRAAGGRFFHMEMSDAFRKDLLANDSLRQKLFSALATTVEGR